MALSLSGDTEDKAGEPARRLPRIKRDTIAQRSARKDAGVQNAERELIENEGRRAFFNERKRWSIAIIAWISFLIVFNCLLAVLVGAGVLDFREYEWFVTVLTVEIVLQIVGLGYVAARYLFAEHRRENHSI